MRGNCLIKVIKFMFLFIIGTLFVFIFTTVEMFFSLKNHTFEQPKKPVKRDWHDYKAMHLDAIRVGIGEHGKVGTLSGSVDRGLEKNMTWEEGFNALLSDAISVNRSLPDTRDKA